MLVVDILETVAAQAATVVIKDTILAVAVPVDIAALEAQVVLIPIFILRQQIKVKLVQVVVAAVVAVEVKPAEVEVE